MYTEKMKYWLMQSDYTARELADEVECGVAFAHKYIKRQLFAGNVEIACTRGDRRSKAFTWCGNDGIELLAIRAAIILRDTVQTPEAKKLASEIFTFMERK